MIFEDHFFAPFLPFHHPSCDISTCLQHVLPVQLTGGRVFTVR